MEYKPSPTTTRTLSDIQKSATDLLNEAQICAEHDPVLGFAAMTLSLACVSAVGEAILGKYKPPNDKSIEAFCERMSKEWLIYPEDGNTKKDPCYVLSGVRNALAHAMSLPNDVCLVKTHEDYYKEYGSTKVIGIVPRLFVGAVRKTIEEIIEQNPNLEFDKLSSVSDRAPATIIDFKNCSSASVNIAVANTKDPSSS